MAKSPIRGYDPSTDQAAGGRPESVEAAPAEVEAGKTEGDATAPVATDPAPPEEPAPENAETQPEKPAEAAPPAIAAEAETQSEPEKAPLKKPLGLSLRKPPSEVKPPNNKMQIDGAIELTLSAANTAVDAAQEIQRLRAELEMVAAGSKRSSRLLLFATLLIAACTTAGLTGALIFYQRSVVEFQALAKINRDVLMTFAGEVKGLATTSRAIEETATVSAQALATASARTEEMRKAIQGFTAAQKSLEAKIAPTSAYEKQFSGLKQPLDALAALNDTINSRLIEIEKARQAREQARKPVAEAPKVEAPRTVARQEPKREAPKENMVRYP